MIKWPFAIVSQLQTEYFEGGKIILKEFDWEKVKQLESKC